MDQRAALAMDRSVRDLEGLMSPQKDAKYLAYEDKFKKKWTTDDSFTPDEVYAAIRRWVLTEYGISDDRPIIRPFYPGGDYERERDIRTMLWSSTTRPFPS